MMADSTREPRRAHILSSINPEDVYERRSRSPTKSRRPKPTPKEDDDTNDTSDRPPRTRSPSEQDTSETRPRRSRLKLKDEKSRRRRDRDRERESDLSRPSKRDRRDRSTSPTSSRSHRRRHDDRSPSRRHRHRHRSRRERSPTPPNPHEPEPLDPEAAFRESLFDAMADDEGAAYWEGVYGQPIHVYPDPTNESGQAGDGNNNKDTLESMTDEEYAAYVRQKMWEKTHAGIMEERARQEERKKAKKAQERMDRHKRDEMDRMARKEEEGRLRKRWEKRFTEYVKRWEDVPTSSKPGVRHASAETILPWPVDSGRREDIDEDAVRRFFVRGLGLGDIGEEAFAKKIKEERVRWHPDKIQQRLGGEVEDVVMKDVTFVFQVVDRLWGELRGKK